jgi:hypothetical protein
MGRINTGRVILGGLLAGLIINVGETIASLLFARQAERVMADLGLTMPGGAAVAIFVVVGFVMGIVLIWLYAAARPRFGPGPKTAVIVALVFWLIGYFLPLLGDQLMGILPLDMMIMASLWGVVEVCIASLAGGWLYKEEAAAA